MKRAPHRYYTIGALNLNHQAKPKVTLPVPDAKDRERLKTIDKRLALLDRKDKLLILEREQIRDEQMPLWTERGQILRAWDEAKAKAKAEARAEMLGEWDRLRAQAKEQRAAERAAERATKEQRAAERAAEEQAAHPRPQWAIRTAGRYRSLASQRISGSGSGPGRLIKKFVQAW